MQSFKESVVWVQSHLNFQNFKVVLNPIQTHSTEFFENFAKRGILLCISQFGNEK